MKDYENNQKLSRAISIILGTFILIGIITPVHAESRLSPGMDVLANDFSMAVDGLVGTEVYLSKKDFANALGVENVGKITIASLPDPTLGRLQIGATYVEVGQTVAERNLDKLKFVPFGTNEIAASFGFCRGSAVNGTVYTCTVYTTKNVNTAPYFNTVNISASTPMTVYSGVTHLGSISASDNENDELSYEIVSGASNGKVKFTNKQLGYYEYTSESGYTGKDSFTVCATDKYGNRSPETKITLRIEAVKDGEVYEDMSGHYANAAVISCVRAGIIEAAHYGECFYPDEYVSRAEFLAFAMKSAGYTGFTAVNTGFTDDADIPSEYKGCIAAAKAFGFINGIETEAGKRFYPNNQITRLEAAVMLSRIFGISGSGTVAVFSDAASVPTWAVNAVGGLCEASILRGNTNGKLDIYAPVTRGAAAQMIYTCNER